MQALFGAGMHPLAAQRLQQLSDNDLSDISATDWACSSRTGPTLTRRNAGAGDRRCRPGPEQALVDAADVDQEPAR